MAEPARNFEQPHERDARLHALGLSVAPLRTTIERGIAARDTCTAFDPPSFPGYLQWATMHRAIREVLAPLDWTPDDSRNFSRVVNSAQTIALTVATGDERTGRPGPQPSTKYPKGSETDLAIATNVQLSFWPEPGQDVEAGPRPRRVTWILLVTTDRDEVRAELSCPKAQDKDGRVVEWSDRIFLPTVERDAQTTTRRDDDDDDEPGIEVPVERI